MDLSGHDLFEVGKIAVQVVLVFILMKVKLEIAEIKIWILENFERREHARADHHKG